MAKVKWERGTVADASGTGLIDKISVPYSRLIELFGKPDDGDGYKTDAEWVLKVNGLVATIYNWKDGRSYCGAHGTDVEDITD